MSPRVRPRLPLSTDWQPVDTPRRHSSGDATDRSRIRA